MINTNGITLSWPFDQIPPLYDVPATSSSFANAVVDFTGLWGHNLSNEFAQTVSVQSPYLHPYVSVKLGGETNASDLSCVIPKK